MSSVLRAPSRAHVGSSSVTQAFGGSARAAQSGAACPRSSSSISRGARYRRKVSVTLTWWRESAGGRPTTVTGVNRDRGHEYAATESGFTATRAGVRGVRSSACLAAAVPQRRWLRRGRVVDGDGDQDAGVSTREGGWGEGPTEAQHRINGGDRRLTWTAAHGRQRSGRPYTYGGRRRRFGVPNASDVRLLAGRVPRPAHRRRVAPHAGLTRGCASLRYDHASLGRQSC